MDRRQFINQIISRTAAAGAVASGLASQGGDRIATFSQRQAENAEMQFRQLRERVRSLDQRQKSLAKGLLLVASVSTGVDLMILL